MLTKAQRLKRNQRIHWKYQGGGQSGKRNALWLYTVGTKPVARCHWCGVWLTFKVATLDHLLEPGHPDRFNKDHQVLACADCNHARGCPVNPNRICMLNHPQPGEH